VNLDTTDRSRLCNIWMDGIDRLKNNGAFLFDHGLVVALYGQVSESLDNNTDYRLKKLIMSLLIYTGSHGIIIELKNKLTIFLKYNPDVAKSVFSFLVRCSNTVEYMSARDDSLIEHAFSLKLNKRFSESLIYSFEPKEYDLRILAAISCCGMSIRDNAVADLSV
jgi:hypothetical protein